MDISLWKQRFLDYAASFRGADGVLPFPQQFKIKHTFDVCGFMQEILSGTPEIPADQHLIFMLAALFHDVSRFEQFQRFRTFRDDCSFDHGDRSAELIAEQNFLPELPPGDVERIRTAVRYHNKFELPSDLPADLLPLSGAVRDADKIAIIKILISYFAQPETVAEYAVKLGLPDREEYSADVVQAVLSGVCVRHSQLRSVNDFKLTMFAWAPFYAFSASAAILLREKYYEQLADFLANPQIRHDVLDVALRTLRQKFAQKGI